MRVGRGHIALICLLPALAMWTAAKAQVKIAVPATRVVFAPLHTYYLSPTGSDSNNGLTPSTAWATPKHSVNCGDVIIAAAGNYTYAASPVYVPFGIGQWGKVSNCPSTSGGIDGNGGIYFAMLLCAGPNVTSCTVSGTSSTNEDFRIDASNWAVEGFWATNSGGSTNANATCFSATSETPTTLHHVALVNDICSTAAGGVSLYSYQKPFAPGGFDYVAVVGMINYNAATSGSGARECESGISLVPSDYDTAAGTHIFIAGTFDYKNVNGNNCIGAGRGTTDGEGIILDTWSAAPYTNQAVIEQNVMWANGSNGFQVFPQNNASTANDGLTTNCPGGCDASKVYFFNNTTYGNVQDPNHGGSSTNGAAPELYLHGVYPQLSAISGGLYSVTNNIFVATENGTNINWGIEIDCAATTNTSCGSYVNFSGNYVYNILSPTSATGGNNTKYWYCNTIACIYSGATNEGTAWPFGTNTYANPGLASPGSLPTGAPSCSAYTNTTDCMLIGYNVYASITPSNAVGYGYQPPRSCAADPYYPTWLKGIVYLQVSGTQIVEKSGLITKPCGL